MQTWAFSEPVDGARLPHKASQKKVKGGGAAGTTLTLQRLREPSLQKLAELRRSFELGNRLQFLEGGSEYI
jgi:hypothetical protein